MNNEINKANSARPFFRNIPVNKTYKVTKEHEADI